MPDCLICYVPKFQNRYRPLGNYTSIQWMPLGIFALADAVVKAGGSAIVLHLGLEKALSPAFRIADYVASRRPRVAAFSIQFHQQLYDSLRAAERVKRACRTAFVVLGGMTASFFAEEILANFPSVDGVIRGEGEVPLVRLVSAIGRKGDLSGVPNLVWRKGEEIVDNGVTYTASKEELDSLDFCNFSTMEHAGAYVTMPKIFTRLRAPGCLRWAISRRLSRKKRNIFFALAVGRGCITNCFYCGGGARAQRALNARKRPVFRDPARVIGDIRRLIALGYDGAYISFDPVPASDAYYRALFRVIRTERLRFDLPFSSWSLPSRDFIDEYGRTFGSGSYIAISPETGSERLRRRARGIPFSNDELLAILEWAESRGVRTTVFFSLGIPGETREDFERTLRLRDEIERRFTLAGTDAFAIEIEPASPWHLDPARYGIVLCRRTLDDFIRDQRDPSYSSMTSLGYYRKEYLGERVSGEEDFARRVLATKCRHFCRRNAACRVAGIGWGLTRLLGINPGSDVEI